MYTSDEWMPQIIYLFFKEHSRNGYAISFFQLINIHSVKEVRRISNRINCKLYNTERITTICKLAFFFFCKRESLIINELTNTWKPYY